MKSMNLNKKFFEADPDAVSSGFGSGEGDANTMKLKEEDLNFIDNLIDDFEGVEDENQEVDGAASSPVVEESSTPVEQIAVVPPTTPEVPSTPSPVSPELQKEEAAAPPEAPTPPVAPAAQPELPAKPQQTPEEFQVAMVKHREETLPQLQAHYKMDDETVAALEANPGEVLPKIFAKMHYDLTQALFSGVMSQVPQVVQQQLVQARKEQELEQAFFGKYPGLRQHGTIVQQALSAALQSDLGKTYEEVESLAASMAAIKLKIPLDQLMSKADLSPAASMGNSFAPANVARPIAPGGSGASFVPPQVQGQRSIWEDMVEFELTESSG